MEERDVDMSFTEGVTGTENNRALKVCSQFVDRTKDSGSWGKRDFYPSLGEK